MAFKKECGYLLSYVALFDTKILNTMRFTISTMPPSYINSIQSLAHCLQWTTLVLGKVSRNLRLCYSRIRPLLQGAFDYHLCMLPRWPGYQGAKRMPRECTQPGGQLGFFACHLCPKICSADRFANAMMRGKCGKFGQSTVEERSRRFCSPCGITHVKYTR